MKEIYLDYRHEPITITDEAYARIVAIINETMVCRRCKKSYTEDNPCVVLNTCLQCFLRSDEAKRHQLSFVGLRSDGQSSGRETYTFLDNEGYVYLTHRSSDSRTLDRSNYSTMLYWGFRPPATIQRGDKEKQLDTHSWNIYGDFKTNFVIVLDYHEYYGDHLRMAFLVSKDGTVVEVNKRKKEIQRLFQAARTQLEATKDVQGRYHIKKDWTTYQLYDSQLYEVISQLASAEYDTRQEKSNE